MKELSELKGLLHLYKEVENDDLTINGYQKKNNDAQEQINKCILCAEDYIGNIVEGHVDVESILFYTADNSISCCYRYTSGMTYGIIFKFYGDKCRISNNGNKIVLTVD